MELFEAYIEKGLADDGLMGLESRAVLLRQERVWFGGFTRFDDGPVALCGLSQGRMRMVGGFRRTRNGFCSHTIISRPVVRFFWFYECLG